MRHALKRAALAAGISATLALAGPAVAEEEFPQESITVIIPFQPGDTDNMLRPFVERMGEFLGQNVVIDYRPGAGGALGAAEVARANPDGYTLVGTSPGSVVVVPLGNPQVSYSFEDFAPVVATSEGALMLMVGADSPFESVQDLVGYARENPGMVTFGTSGTMGITHLLAEAFAAAAGIEMTHIPFQGSGPAITALLGGHIDMASSAIAPAAGHVAEGTLRPLAVFAAERLSTFPEVPTIREAGIEVGSPTLYGLLAPAGTPEAVRQRLFEAAAAVLETYPEETAERLNRLGAQVHLLGPDDYAAYLAGQNTLFESAVAAVNAAGN